MRKLSFIKMYSFYKRLFVDANKVDSFGLALPHVGFDTNIYYKLSNDIILCDGVFHQSAEDTENFYYVLETSESGEKRYVEHEFFEWCSLDDRTNCVTTSYWLNVNFMEIINSVKDDLPPFVTVKRYSSMLFTVDDIGNFYLDVDITSGMLNPNVLFKDYKHFCPFLVNEKGESHCMHCGWLYDGNAQCDCWKYSDLESD